jgi:hypothetical protein
VELVRVDLQFPRYTAKQIVAILTELPEITSALPANHSPT